MSPGINPTLHTGAIAALENLVNRALLLAPRARAELAELEDCVFALQCSSPPLDMYLQPVGDSVRLMGIYEGPVTTRVKGSAADFTELATAEDPAASLINGGLELEGDSAPLLELQQILATLDIDWEAPLVDSLGDVVGHQLAEVLRAGFSWSGEARNSLERQLEEFIHEEARLSPPRLELDDFYSDVQELSLRVDRLESRSRRLRQKIERLKA